MYVALMCLLALHLIHAGWKTSKTVDFRLERCSNLGFFIGGQLAVTRSARWIRILGIPERRASSL